MDGQHAEDLPQPDPLRLPGTRRRGTLTPEEALLDREAPRRLLFGSGLDEDVRAIASRLAGLDDGPAAEALLAAASAELWRRGSEAGCAGVPDGVADIDDRPLYWARLALTAAVRQWSELCGLPTARAQALLGKVDELSRGQDLLPRDGGGPYIIVTGFDPFRLDADDRRSNPSGAIALALDGTLLDGPRGPVRVRAALFPVRWRDFGVGMVERALEPAFSSERPPLAVFTVSQGSPGIFSLEAHNGAWRAGEPDNEGACHQGLIPHAAATGAAQPQWTRSTLPRREIVAAVGQHPFALEDRTEVVEVSGDAPIPPPRTSCPADRDANTGTSRPEGPTAGSQARAGGGGNYLSNEIAYRATLLRDALSLHRLPVGHVHTPVLTGLDPDAATLSSPEFETHRRQQIAQARAIVTAALHHLP